MLARAASSLSGTKAIAMWRGSWSTFRTVVVSLLTLAMLLVYAVPRHASLVSHDRSIVPHEHVVAVAADETTAGRDHEQAPCADAGLLDDGVCCSVAQCATMHGGLIADAVEAFVPRLAISTHLAALAMPEGIGNSPALHPPRLIL
jgi:hypothetical protein